MKKQGGFTLIELVVVIVILGILAVTAAPRFLNLQDDARDATLDGLRGAVSGAMGISYGKAAIKGIETLEVDEADLPASSVDSIVYSFGYPTAAEDGILSTIDISDEFTVLDSTEDDKTDHTNATIDIGITNYTERCVRYAAATGTDTPATVTIVSGAGNCGV
ncbi:type II secretion system protein [Vibrio sp. 03-59-1]|uniref:type II secretion system protein n=1 Tax=Vibrio sp. 03-59-1 TaxID=2607607 RepID=UPI001493619F|nr:type II secretion system protein [Vibrio sp. 03-59-1]NOH83632.1 type II secretion system protein [Vibrio sp. 03-59-1]